MTAGRRLAIRLGSLLTLLALVAVGPGGLIETGYHLLHVGEAGHGSAAHLEAAGSASHADHCSLGPASHHQTALPSVADRCPAVQPVPPLALTATSVLAAGSRDGLPLSRGPPARV